jgi:hypothetical protein
VGDEDRGPADEGFAGAAAAAPSAAVAQRVEEGAVQVESGGLDNVFAQVSSGDVRVGGERGGLEVAQEAGADAERLIVAREEFSPVAGLRRRLCR